MPVSQKIVESLQLLGKSDVMHQLYKMIGRLCNADCAILLIGERGSGKKMVAQALHYFSHRAAFPFTTITGDLIRETNDEELLGINEGHQADFTCYITGFTSMPAFVQQQLVRIHRNREYKCAHANEMRKHNIRFVVAHEGDIKEELEADKMPIDLFYDWNFLPLFVPPLRDRKEDIPILANFFLEKLSAQMEIPGKEISPEAMDILKGYDWPGNLSELKAVLRVALRNCRGNYIRAEHLPNLEKRPLESKEAFARLEMFLGSKLNSYIDNMPATQNGNLYRLLMPQIEKSLFQYALKKSRGNKNKAAQWLGLHRNTLNKKLQNA